MFVSGVRGVQHSDLVIHTCVCSFSLQVLNVGPCALQVALLLIGRLAARAGEHSGPSGVLSVLLCSPLSL